LDPKDGKALVARFYEQVVNRGDLAAIDGLLSPDFVHNGEARGISGQRTAIKALLTAFPDLQVTTKMEIAEEDLVAVRQEWTGTHKGEFLGAAPTNRQISFTSQAMLRIADGRIVEAWVNEDDLGLLRQIGAPVVS
jgi:predicted ester cyclase